MFVDVIYCLPIFDVPVSEIFVERVVTSFDPSPQSFLKIFSTRKLREIIMWKFFPNLLSTSQRPGGVDSHAGSILNSILMSLLPTPDGFSGNRTQLSRVQVGKLTARLLVSTLSVSTWSNLTLTTTSCTSSVTSYSFCS